MEIVGQGFFDKHPWIVADFSGDPQWYFSTVVCAAKTVDFWTNILTARPSVDGLTRREFFVRHKDQQRWYTAHDCRYIANGMEVPVQ